MLYGHFGGLQERSTGLRKIRLQAEIVSGKWFLEGRHQKASVGFGIWSITFMENNLEVAVAPQGRRSLVFRQSNFWSILERFWKLCGRFLDGRWVLWSIPLRFLETTETFICPRYSTFWITRSERGDILDKRRVVGYF